jgi:phage tail-like protein
MDRTIDSRDRSVPFFRIAVLCALLLPICLSAQTGGDKRSYTGGRFSLDIDGQSAGVLRSIDGGTLVKDVAQGTPPEQIAKKHIGGVKYEDISITCGLPVANALSEWINATFAGKNPRKDFSIVVSDNGGRESSRMEFANALITEVAFPALDAGAKDPAYLTIKFSPEATRYKLGDGSVVPAVKDVKQKSWLPCNFRLELGNLPCDRVGKIDAFTWKQGIRSAPGSAGQTPPMMISFIIPAADRIPFGEWVRRKGPRVEGTLLYLGPDARETLAALQMREVEPVKLVPSPDGNKEEVSIKFIRCELK